MIWIQTFSDFRQPVLLYNSLSGACAMPYNEITSLSFSKEMNTLREMDQHYKNILSAQIILGPKKFFVTLNKISTRTTKWDVYTNEAGN